MMVMEEEVTKETVEVGVKVEVVATITLSANLSQSQ